MKSFMSAPTQKNLNPKLNKSSKIFKELDTIINGNTKLNIISVTNEGSAKCDKFVDGLR